MSAKVSEFDTRPAAHAALKTIRDGDDTSTAECRYNPVTGKTEVWDGSMTDPERATGNVAAEAARRIYIAAAVAAEAAEEN